MQKKWLILALVFGLLLTGCGKKKNNDDAPMFQDPVPVLTEAPTWPSMDLGEDSTIGPLSTDSTAPEGETLSPVETVPAETLPVNTPSETPSGNSGGETVWAISHVNVRDAAGFNSKVIGTLEGGDTVTRISVGNNGWSQISFEGKTAYVANNYLSADSPEKAGGATYQEVNQTVKATAKVNIRRGPGVDYPVLGQLQAGEEVSRTGIGSKGWSRIKYDGKVCYVSNNYLKVVSNDAVPSEK